MRNVILIIFIFLFSSNAFADITTGLQLWYTFDEGTGTTANDSSGNSNTGAESNTTYVTGKIGPFALSFNGTSSSVSTSQSSSIQFGTGNFSVSAWVFVNNTATMRTINNWNGSGAGNQGWLIDINDTVGSTNAPGFLRFKAGDGTNIIDNSVNASLPTAGWHDVTITVTRSSSTGVIYYLDGAQVGTGQSDTALTGSVNQSTTSANIGYLFTGTGPFFNGNIDEVREYNRALSSADVLQLFQYTGPSSIPIIAQTGRIRLGKAMLGHN